MTLDRSAYGTNLERATSRRERSHVSWPPADMDRAWARAVVDDAFDGPYDRCYAVGCAYLRRVGRGRVQRVTGVDCVRELVGPLVVEARLPEPGAPSCAHHDGDVSIAVRHPDTEVVLAAMRMITRTIAIEYG